MVKVDKAYLTLRDTYCAYKEYGVSLGWEGMEEVESHNEFWKVVEIDKGKAGMKCQRSFGHPSGQCHMNFVKKKLDRVGFSDDDRNPRP